MTETEKPYHLPYVVKNFLDQEDCPGIINFINENVEGKNDHARRKLIRYGIDYMNGHTDPLPDDDFGKMIKEYCDRAGKIVKILYNIEEELYLSTVWFSRQQPGANIIRHMDTDSGFQKQYMYSGVLYLNTPETGGEIVFSRLNFSYKPEAGDFIFFESADKRSIHGVNAASDFRYAIPIWFTTDPEYRMA